MHSFQLFAQGMYTPFGQNRVQYGLFDWQFIRSENFDAYFYSGGREIAQFAARTAETELNEVERLIDHRLSSRIEVICYNSHSDYKQSNFGLADNPTNTGGTSQISSNKIFVYFNGNHEYLIQQIRAGISLVLVNELLFGGSLQERVQNAALINMPDWFMMGLTGHIGNKWNIDHTNKLKDLLSTRKTKNFNRLIYQDEELAGLSFWKFLHDKYGDEIISNMVYVTRISRNYESALVYLTGEPMKKISKDWMRYYKDLYAKEDSLRAIPTDKIKIKRRFQDYVLNEIRVNEKGDYLAFTTNKRGKYKVWVMDTKTGKTKKVHKGGVKYHQVELDKSFPLLAWHPGSEKLAYIHEKKGKVILTTVDLLSKKKQHTWLVKFDKVTAFDYADNERLLVMSAIRKGQSDIFTYDLKTGRERQITNDFFDDLQPRFANGSTQILFSSNRNTDSLSFPPPQTLDKGNNFDIYLLDLENDGPRMKRLSYTPHINETHPIPYEGRYYSYISDYNGIKNRYAVRLETEPDFYEFIIKYYDSEIKPDTLYFDQLTKRDSVFEYKGKTIIIDSNVATIDTILHEKDLVFTYPITNYSRNIIAHDVSRQTQKVYALFFYNRKLTIRHEPTQKDIVNAGKQTETFPTMTRLKTGYTVSEFNAGKVVYSDRRFIKDIEESLTKDEPVKEEPKSIYPFYFVSEFIAPDTKKEQIKIKTPFILKPQNDKVIKLKSPRYYEVTFFSDELVSQLDNSVINSYYQPISASGGNLFNPGLNGMFKLGMVDLFEDYKLVGGFRLALDLSGVDYFLTYENLKKRFDHRVTFYRQVRNGNSEFIPVRNTSHELRYEIRYPFNPVWSLRLSPFARMDRDVFRAIGNNTLERPDNYTYWGGSKIEIVFDNTTPRGLNLWNGTRFKVFYEHYRNLSDREVQLNAWGFDFRHYQKIHRQLIFAGRATYNNSFGPAKVKYVLGGVDNQLFPSYDANNNSIGAENFVFQALATNMRGFDQNIRNGNNFAVINAELRWPIFTYLFNRPIRSEFLRTFQIVPFYDIGTAWIGKDPYSEENTFNQKIVEIAYLRATVTNVREPIVMGYGSGLRAKLLGYFVRFDTAWGIQDGEVNEEPVFHLSLSMDF